MSHESWDEIQIEARKRNVSLLLQTDRFLEHAGNSDCSVYTGETFIGILHFGFIGGDGQDQFSIVWIGCIYGASMHWLYLWYKLFDPTDFIIPNELAEIDWNPRRLENKHKNKLCKPSRIVLIINHEAFNAHIWIGWNELKEETKTTTNICRSSMSIDWTDFNNKTAYIRVVDRQYSILIGCFGMIHKFKIVSIFCSNKQKKKQKLWGIIHATINLWNISYFVHRLNKKKTNVWLWFFFSTFSFRSLQIFFQNIITDVYLYSVFCVLNLYV